MAWKKNLLMGALVAAPFAAYLLHPSIKGLITSAQHGMWSDWSSWYGLPVSYLGLIFSAYAAYEVRQLTKRYVARARLPGLRTAIRKEAAVMVELAAEPLEELNRSAVVPRLVANLNSIVAHKSQVIAVPLRQARTDLSRLERSLRASANANVKAADLNDFWGAYSSIQQLIVGIENFLADERKRQDVQ